MIVEYCKRMIETARPQLDPRTLHHEAVFDPYLTTDERVTRLDTAITLYDSEADIARAQRDRAKFRHRQRHEHINPDDLPIEDWREDIEASVSYLQQAAAGNPESEIMRELAASLMMHGRLLLHDGVAQNNFEDLLSAQEKLQSGMELVHDINRSTIDQYEINHAPLLAIADRYATGARLGMARIVGLYKLARMSEDSNYANYTNHELSTAGRRRARLRAFGRSTLAATINYAPGKQPHPRTLTTWMAAKATL